MYEVLTLYLKTSKLCRQRSLRIRTRCQRQKIN